MCLTMLMYQNGARKREKEKSNEHSEERFFEVTQCNAMQCNRKHGLSYPTVGSVTQEVRIHDTNY